MMRLIFTFLYKLENDMFAGMLMQINKPTYSSVF